MSSNPLSVLVSIKTLSPEVEDYWLSIPSHLKTIDEFKLHILTDNFIVKDMDDIQLYLYNGLLRGNASIGDVLQNRDCIEVRVKSATKKRISPSVDNVSDRLKRIKISTNECDGKASIDSSTSTDTIADTITPAAAVVTQSHDIWAEFVGTSVAKPMRYECCSPGCDYKTDKRHHFLRHRNRIHRPFMCRFCDLVSFKSDFKLEAHYLRVHPSHCLDTPWIQCTHEGCVYQTKHNKDMRKHIDKMHGLKVGVA